MTKKNGWIGVDFDGVLCVYDFAAPIPLMVNRVKKWIAAGYEVRIFTARVSYVDVTKREEARSRIQDWCEEHIGERLQVTNAKDFNMLELWDDKAITVIKNVGLSLREYMQRKRR